MRKNIKKLLAAE